MKGLKWHNLYAATENLFNTQVASGGKVPAKPRGCARTPHWPAQPTTSPESPASGLFQAPITLKPDSSVEKTAEKRGDREEMPRTVLTIIIRPTTPR